jgi:hypothetical protein
MPGQIHVKWAGRLWEFKVERERSFQVGQRLFFGFASARDVDFQTLGDVPVSLLPDGCCEGALHECIFSTEAVRWHSFEGPSLR